METFKLQTLNVTEEEANGDVPRRTYIPNAQTLPTFPKPVSPFPPAPAQSAASVPRAQPLHGIEMSDLPGERKCLLNHSILTMQKY